MPLRKASEGNPRPGDLPVTRLAELAELEIIQGWDVYIKFSCAWCGERCILQDANTIWPQGECCICGKETIIDVGGLLLQKKGQTQ